MIVAYPALMSQWPAAGQLDFATQLQLIFGGVREVDAITGATPSTPCAPRCAAPPAPTPSSTACAAQLMDGPAFGWLGGKGGEWVALGYLVGGLWLIQRRIITWHIPVAFCGALFASALVLWGVRPEASPRRCSTWPPAAPCSAPSSSSPTRSPAPPPPAASCSLRPAPACSPGSSAASAPTPTVAFATLLMNILVPLIDMKTQAPVFGHKKD
jgi:electron transport complex protein RnfD